MTHDLSAGSLTLVPSAWGIPYPDAAQLFRRGALVDRYRLLVVVDVLDGSTPEQVMRCVSRHHGDVVRFEVLDDGNDDLRMAEHRAPRGEGPGSPGPWLDA